HAQWRSDRDDVFAGTNDGHLAELDDRLVGDGKRQLQNREIEIGGYAIDTRVDRVARGATDPHRKIVAGDVRVGDDRVLLNEEPAAAARGRLDGDDGRTDASDEILQRNASRLLRLR